MKQVLEMLWRKRNPSTLLVGMQTGADTLENSMEFPQKTKDGIVFLCSNPLLGQCPKNPELPIKEPMHPNVHSSINYTSQVLPA